MDNYTLPTLRFKVRIACFATRALRPSRWRIESGNALSARARLQTTLSTVLDRRRRRRRGCSLSRLLERSIPFRRSRGGMYRARDRTSGRICLRKYGAEGTHLARAREIRRRVVRETRHPGNTRIHVRTNEKTRC